MKGSTEIKVNQATMVEALQQYFDGVLTKDHKMIVTEVVRDPANSYGGVTDNFIVRLGDPAEVAKP